MKPIILDESQLGCKSQKCQTGTAAETLAKQVPTPKDFVIVFSFKSVTDELKSIDKVFYVIDTFTKEAQLFYTEIEHVYVIAFNFEKEVLHGDMKKLFNAIKDAFTFHIGDGDVLIQSYYRADVFLNTNHTIKAERCVLDIHVNKETPLDEDFVFTITNQYSNKSKSFILESASKVIKIK